MKLLALLAACLLRAAALPLLAAAAALAGSAPQGPRR
jgi:hypothetical protein